MAHRSFLEAAAAFESKPEASHTFDGDVYRRNVIAIAYLPNERNPDLPWVALRNHQLPVKLVLGKVNLGHEAADLVENTFGGHVADQAVAHALDEKQIIAAAISTGRNLQWYAPFAAEAPAGTILTEGAYWYPFHDAVRITQQNRAEGSYARMGHVAGQALGLLHNYTASSASASGSER